MLNCISLLRKSLRQTAPLLLGGVFAWIVSGATVVAQPPNTGIRVIQAIGGPDLPEQLPTPDVIKVPTTIEKRQPQKLTSATKKLEPLPSLSRRQDGLDSKTSSGSAVVPIPRFPPPLPIVPRGPYSMVKKPIETAEKPKLPTQLPPPIPPLPTAPEIDDAKKTKSQPPKDSSADEQTDSAPMTTLPPVPGNVLPPPPPMEVTSPTPPAVLPTAPSIPTTSTLPSVAPAAPSRTRALGAPSNQPAEQVREGEVDQFVVRKIEPKNTLEIIVNRPTVLVLKQSPKRIQPPDEKIADYELVSTTELSLTGKAVGSTVMNLWFSDPKTPGRDMILSYLVKVIPEPTPALPAPVDPQVAHEQRVAKLQEQINRSFPDSIVRMTMVGNQVILSGQAKDRAEANAILQLLERNLPCQGKCIMPGQVGVNVQLTGADLREGRFKPGSLENAMQTGIQVVNLLRVPGERQVLLRVTVAEVNRSAARSIGINFSILNKTVPQVVNKLGGALASGLKGNILPMVLDNGQTIAAVNALRTLDLARSLAEPTLVAMDGETASFQAGGQFPVPIVTGATAVGMQGVQFIPFGVQLSFTPYISDKDRIRLQMQAEVSTRDLNSVTNIGGAGVTALNSRNFQTVVELREGQTMAVAGLLQHNMAGDAHRVPLLGDVPVLGRLFGHDRAAAAEKELIVLVTPELVHPLEACETPPLPGADIFEPGDIEFYLLGRMESRRKEDYRSPARTDLSRMLRYRNCEQLFIFGPCGHSDTCGPRP